MVDDKKKRVRLWTIIIFLLLFGLSSNAWFFADQPFRIPITINSPSNLTDYQVLIDLNSSSLSGDNNNSFWINSRSDGLDVRFTNQDDNESLDFFREVFFDNQRAKFWIKLENISSGDQNVYMYYGSNNSDNNSNWENTFINDGNGNTIFGWGLTGVSPWFSNGTQYQNDSTTGTQHMMRAPIPEGSFSNALAYAVSIELQCDASSDCEVRYYLFDEGNANTAYVQYTGTSNTMVFRPSGDDGDSCSISITDGTLYDVNLTRSYDGNFTMYVNSLSCSKTDSTDVSGATQGFSHAGGEAGRADAIYRKKTNSGGEPAYSLQTFEDQGETTFRLVDEEALTGLDGNVSINGTPIDVNTTGFFDLNVASQSYPLTLTATMSGYDDRSFVFSTPEGLEQFSFIGLRTDSESSDIDFIFFAPDEVTKISTQAIAVMRGSVLSGFSTTSSAGETTFNLAPQDSSYTVNIFESGSETIVQYSYTTVSVTVNRPRDEGNNSLISPNLFNLDIGGLGLQNFTSQALPISSIVILGNTEDVYTLRIVDENSDGQQYYARNYVMQAIGDVNTLTINPYLIDIDDGILVNLTVRDISTNQTIPDIRIQMYTGISGVNTVVEDRITDAAGVAQVVMLSQKTYNLLITSPNQDINYFNGFQALSPSSQNFTIWIDFFENFFSVTTKNTTIFISPQTSVLTTSPQIIDVNVDTNATFDFIYVQAFDSNTIVDQNNCSSSPCNVSLNLNLNSFDSNFATILITIQNGDFNYTRTVTYTISTFLNGIVTRIQNLKLELGPVSLGLIMFTVAFGVIGWIGGSPFGNNMSQIFLIVIIFGAFYWLWFLETPLFAPFLAAVFGVMLIYFWARQKGGP